MSAKKETFHHDLLNSETAFSVWSHIHQELLNLNKCIAYVLLLLTSGLPFLWDEYFLRYESNFGGNKKIELRKSVFFLKLVLNVGGSVKHRKNGMVLPCLKRSLALSLFDMI